MAGTDASIYAAHIVFLGHLLIGYWFHETDTYDITWTTPFCIMTLRCVCVCVCGEYCVNFVEKNREKFPKN